MPSVAIFFSRVTAEFGSYDATLRQWLTQVPGAVLKTNEDLLPYESGFATLDKLWDWISTCDAVIHAWGREVGAIPPSSMVQEFLNRQPALQSWLKSREAPYQPWSYTQWEVYLAKFRQVTCGDRPMIFVCGRAELSAATLMSVTSVTSTIESQSVAHLAALAGLNCHANISFQSAEQLMLALLTGPLGRLINRSSQSALINVDSIVAALASTPAALALRNWPQLSGAASGGSWLERPELNVLLSRIAEAPHSVTLLLGEPGCGKSALFARLAQTLGEHSTAFVPLKVDLIGHEAVDRVTLAAELELPQGVDLATSVRRLAESGTVVLLIDQLDALSSLVVQSPRRLRVFTELIGELAGAAGVHVVASCRTFEQRHDPVLRTLEASSLTLELPAWPEVDAILSADGVTAADWNQELKEVLRLPQALRTFLELRACYPDLPLPNSYQDLLNELWQQRVLNSSDPKVVGLAQRVTELLASREELWLPEALFDDDRPSLSQLIASGVLHRESQRVGFRHQTLFEHARARGFARDPRTLVEAVQRQQGRLRVRPQVWHALIYLRQVDPTGYASVLAQLLGWTDLRDHLRMLLIEHMGMQKAPLAAEATLMVRAADDALWRARVINASSHSPGWFHLFQRERLPAWMLEAPQAQGPIFRALLAALGFDQAAVLALIRRHWLPRSEMAERAWQVMTHVPLWDAEVVSDLIRVGASLEIHASRIDEAIHHAAQSAPLEAPKLLAAWLNRLGEFDAADESTGSEGESGESADTEFVVGKRCREALQTESFYCCNLVAAAAPEPFVVHVVPVILRIFEGQAGDVGEVMRLYRPTSSVSTDVWDENEAETGRDGVTLLSAVATAMLRWAAVDSTNFLAHVREWWHLDLEIVQRLFARSLVGVAESFPSEVADFLCADSRRFALGPQPGFCADSWALIAAVAPHLAPEDMARVERAMVDWSPYRKVEGEESPVVERRQKRRREARLHLLLAMPEANRSTAMQELIEAEQLEMPDVAPPARISFRAEQIGSPVPFEEILASTDEQILATIHELPNSTGSSHPHDFMRGGAVQFSCELGKLAESDPERAMRLVRRIDPATSSIYAGRVLEEVAKAADSSALFTFAQELLDLGFDDASFRDDLARALSQTIKPGTPLPESLFSLLQSWLSARSDVESRRPDSEARSGSLLWSHGGLIVIPSSGNYPLLKALLSSCRFEACIDWARWISILEAHVLRMDRSKVWSALSFELQFLGHADRGRATALIGRLLESQPDLFELREGARVLAWASHGAHESDFLRWLRLVLSMDSTRSAQLAGEILMLRRASHPQDSEIAALLATATTDVEQLTKLGESFHTGVAYSAAELWHVDTFRQVAHQTWLALLASADAKVLAALSDLFRPRSESMFEPDQSTRELLQALIERPAILGQPNADGLIEPLVSLLKQSWEPELIGQTCIALVGQVGGHLDNMATAWSFSAEPLLDVVQLLQESSNTSAQGLGVSLLESLLAYNFGAAGELLTDLDRRMPVRTDFPSRPSCPRRPTRTRRRH